MTESLLNPAFAVRVASRFAMRHLSSHSSASGAAAGQPPGAALMDGDSDGVSVGHLDSFAQTVTVYTLEMRTDKESE